VKLWAFGCKEIYHKMYVKIVTNKYNWKYKIWNV